MGDNVEFMKDEKTGKFVITRVQPRINQLVRPFVSNISQLLIVISPEPAPDLLLVDKLVINSKINKIEPIFIINKSDIDSTLFSKIKNEYRFTKIKMIEFSVKSKQNLEVLKDLLKNNITALAGQSATGKTSIINLICGHNRKTNDLSEKIKRGKNTTTNAELIVLDKNSFILDTAGFSKIEFENFDPKFIKEYYDEFTNQEKKCVFNNCNHITEGKFCNVIKNLDNIISAERYERYKQIYLECANNWENRYN